MPTVPEERDKPASLLRVPVAANGRHRSRGARRFVVLASLSIALVIAVLACIAVGGVSIPVGKALAMFAQRLGLPIDESWTAQQESVLFAIRLPRVLLAVVVGSGLGVAGACMQGVFRNPLVDPGLLGVSTGAALGAVVSIVVGDSLFHGAPSWIAPYALPMAAFSGGLLAMFAVQRLALVDGRTVVTALLLGGIAVNALASALMGLLMYIANDSQLRTLTFWTLGSLGGATWKVLLVTAPFIVIPTMILPRLARPLNAMLLGDGDAKHLGVNVERTRRIIIVLVALAVGAQVSVSGMLGFVGLVVPHVVRLAAGPDHRLVLPSSALLGAILLLFADAVARTAVVPAELPLGVVTACIGTPFFIGLLMRERRRIA